MWPSGDWSLLDPLTAPGAAPDAAPFHVCRFNESWLSLIIGSLERLKDRTIWDGDTAAVDEVLQQLDEASNQLATEYSPPTMTFPVGMITPYGGTTAPEGWHFCDGTALDRTIYADLFSVVGTAFGVGDGVITFNLPDLDARVPVGSPATASGTGSSQPLGVKFGASSATLALANIPPHAHSYQRANTSTPGGAVTGSGRYVTSTSTIDTGTAGGSGGAATAFAILPPSLAVKFIIRLTA